jgi:hypothetical protein
VQGSFFFEEGICYGGDGGDGDVVPGLRVDGDGNVGWLRGVWFYEVGVDSAVCACRFSDLATLM